MDELIKRDDALAACDIAPPDEWNDYTKGGYDFAAEECKRGIAALPAVTVKPLRYFEPEGSTVEQMRDHARQHPLAKEGDMKLVWVNEGDLSIYLLIAMQSAPVADSQPAIDPAAIREAALREAAQVLTNEIDLARVAMPQVIPILAADRKAILALIGEKK